MQKSTREVRLKRRKDYTYFYQYVYFKGDFLMSERRLNVGLIINCFADDYNSSICKGATLAAEELDCNLFIFPGRLIDEPAKSRNELMNVKNCNTVYAYANEKNLDLLIVPIGILFQSTDKEKMLEFLKGFGNLPIVTLSVECEGYPCVRYDCRPGLAGVINHLIDHHGCRRIAFIAGPDGQKDSDERLEVYRSCLAEKKIPYDERLVLHGTFSDKDDTLIENFLTRHHFDLDALCCANDAVASAAYAALRRHNLHPGKDIIVTGYDNISYASSCIPPLTTVNANVYDTGYRAVIMGVEAVRKGEKAQSQILPSAPIIRESCCGIINNGDTFIEPDSDIVSDINNIISGLGDASPTNQMVSMRFFNAHSRQFLRMLFSEVSDSQVKQLSIQALIERFRLFCMSDAIDNITIHSLCDFLDAVQSAALHRVSDCDKEKQIYVLFNSLQKLVINILNSINYSFSHKLRNGLYFSGGIMRSAENIRTDSHSAIISILNNLASFGIRSSYLYLGEKPREIKTPDDICPYESFHLSALHNGKYSRTLFDDKIVFSRDEILNNRFTESDLRRTVILSPLFSAREQYGLIMCNITSYQFLDFLQTVINQVGSAVETAYLLDRLSTQLDAVQNENQLLSTMATRDTLTGCYNRLGFFERAGGAVVSPINKGRRGFMIYADVNSLKYINDKFLHENGDFSLNLVSCALAECLGSTGIVGRLGGDEFAALWITDANETCESVFLRVKNCIEAHSKAAKKPYPISASLGVYSFICNDDLVLQELIDEADHLQYNDKANKPVFS